MCESRVLRQGLVNVDKTVEIVILAMVAAFLGLRLISVLGRRAEHEDQPLQPRLEPKGDAAPRVAVPDLADRGGNGGTARPVLPGITPAIERGLKEVALTDKRFDAFLFIEGAKGAYRMVLEAFWSGDKETLAKLCDPAVSKLSKPPSPRVRRRAKRWRTVWCGSTMQKSSRPASKLAWRASRCVSRAISLLLPAMLPARLLPDR